MAKNPPKGPGRKGAVRKRSQTYNLVTKHWTKRDTRTGRFVDAKSDSESFKGVRREK